MARPKANINWDEIGKMLEADCTAEGIAASIGIDRDTLYIRCKKDLGKDFSAFRQEKRAKGNDLLKAKQFQLAMKGDKTMLVWLGKQRLGQSDKAETKTDGATTVTVRYVDGGTDAEHS